MSIEGNLEHNESIVGKSFQYWQCLYEKGIIESHVINLQLQHLKYAFDHKLNMDKEYYRTRSLITDHCHFNYKPYSLMDFIKALKIHYSTSQLEIIQSSKVDQHLEKKCQILQSVKINPENINQQHKAIRDSVRPHPIIEDENNINQTNAKKKSRKKRKKKLINTLKNINNNSNTETREIFNSEYLTNFENSTKQILTSKRPVKVFVRQSNKKYNSDTVCMEPLISSKKKTVRDVFSEILKQCKMEILNQL